MTISLVWTLDYGTGDSVLQSFQLEMEPLKSLSPVAEVYLKSASGISSLASFAKSLVNLLEFSH